MKPVWLHIGLAKTATSSLQRLLFSRHPEIGYLGKNWVDSEKARQALVHMARAPERKFKADEIRSAFGELTSPFNERAEKRVLLLSEEDLTTFRFIDAGICARRAATIFPHAKILLVVREPLEWLQSMYFFRLSLRFPETLDGFNAWLRGGLERRLAKTDMGQIQIGKLVDAYARCFGAENLTVLRYEDLAADEEGFVGRLSELLGVHPGVALALFRRNDASRYPKTRITEAQQRFFEKYKLVIIGQYRDYLEEIAPMLDDLEEQARGKAVAMMQIDFAGESRAIETRLKELSIFLDRACRRQLQDGKLASASATPELKKQVMAIWEPGARDVAARLNPQVGAYFGTASTA